MSGPQGGTERLSALSIQRWTPLSRAFTGGALALAAALIFVPVLLSANVTQKLTSLFILIMIAVMWNALAGYGGLVSVGQQAYIGIGAYGTVLLAHQGLEPYAAMVLAVVLSGLVSVPASYLLLRMKGGQFAIASWVFAEVFAIIVTLRVDLGAGTGISLIELNRYGAADRQAFTYWLTLAATTITLGLIFVLLRSRLGSSLQAIRDDEDAAASVGVKVMAGKRILYIIASTGCGAAGAMTLANTLFIVPSSIFSVKWTAFMIFMVLVGGLGTFEGPIIGAVILFGIQDLFADQGVWYLVGLGMTAILFALLLPRGLWGTVGERFGIQLMPVGYRVRGLGRTGRSAAPAVTPTEEPAVSGPEV
ncbi:MAG: branched-chain amino acid ABC transporter permease [Thermoleophilia bacterium]|nr:branched-chain amino acid ABC transporter permease [Thermoleophilia bacterium]